MARPAQFDRSKAVEDAMNEFWRSGYEACSAKALSEHLGISRSSFYNSFGNRDQLFKEVLALYLTHSPDSVLGERDPGIPVRRLLTRTFRSVCKMRAQDAEGRGCLAVNSVTELCNVHDTLGHMLQEAIRDRLENIEHLLQLAAARGEIDDDADTHALALAVQNLLIGLNVLCKVVRNENELWRVAELTLKGLGLFDEEADRDHAVV